MVMLQISVPELLGSNLYQADDYLEGMHGFLNFSCWKPEYALKQNKPDPSESLSNNNSSLLI
jgi:hypothetical protein